MMGCFVGFDVSLQSYALYVTTTPSDDMEFMAIEAACHPAAPSGAPIMVDTPP